MMEVRGDLCGYLEGKYSRQTHKANTKTSGGNLSEKKGEWYETSREAVYRLTKHLKYLVFFLSEMERRWRALN